MEAVGWLGLVTIGYFLVVSALLLGTGFRLLNAGDRRVVEEARRAACGPHEWARTAGGALECRRCGWMPGGKHEAA